MCSQGAPTVYIIKKWSALNSPENWLGHILIHYEGVQSFRMVRANFISGFLLYDNSAVLVAEDYLDNITHFIKDIANLAEDEIECIKMLYPYAKLERK